jgi:hypothetical protein
VPRGSVAPNARANELVVRCVGSHLRRGVAFNCNHCSTVCSTFACLLAETQAREGSESCGSLGPLGPLMVATQAPTVAGNLMVKPLGMSQVKLTWAGATDKGRVRRYEVQRRDPGSTSFVQVGTTRTTSYIDTALAAGSNYSYRVLVRDARGSLKKYSGVASVTTGSPTIVPLRSP